MIAFEQKMRAGGIAALHHAGEFFMGTDPVHQTLRMIKKKLMNWESGTRWSGRWRWVPMVMFEIPPMSVSWSRVMAISRFVNISMDWATSLFLPAAVTCATPKPACGSNFLITGDFPGDGRPKPIAFPDPASASVEIAGIRYLTLASLIELKLASGITAPHRLKDIADIQDLIRVLQLPRSLGDSLHEYVRPKYFELFDSLHTGHPDVVDNA